MEYAVNPQKAALKKIMVQPLNDNYNHQNQEMNLSEIILDCKNYEDTGEMMCQVFAKKINGRFEPASEAVLLKLTSEEMEMNTTDISNSKCPGFDYFLELFILQDFYNDLEKLEEYKSDIEKVKRIIYYAEFDA